MRLHRLDLTAFGPFAGRETVDFDALADGGLFLFTGPTGAGKTTILDAVCFALYGQVPGARAISRSLRSDHAADGVAPCVALEVTLRGRRLRVTRSPAWERTKRRGAGTTTEQSRVHLEEATGADWITLSTRLDETGQLLGGLLGLTLAQFCQVVLLPQGQFAAFLRADAEKRRELLESLFDTGRFAAVERWLVASRQEATRSLDAVDERMRQVFARVAEVACTDVPDDLDAATCLDWCEVLLEQAAAARLTAEVASTAAQSHCGDAAAALRTALDVVSRQELRVTLGQRLDRLTDLEPGHQAASREIEAARAVAPLVPLLSEVSRLRGDLATARATADELIGGLATELLATGSDSASGGVQAWSLPGGSPSPAALSSAAWRHREERATLAAMSRDEGEADRLTAATATQERRVVELAARSRQLAVHLDSAPARRAELETAREACAAATAALPGSVAALTDARSRCQSAQRRDLLQSRRGAASDSVRAHTDAAQTARQHWLDLRQARLDGMAAELAEGLADGIDCPVCGSVAHPRLAQAAPGAVDRQQEADAESVLRDLDDQRTTAERALAALEVDRAAARAAAGGDSAVAALQRTVDELTSRVDELSALSVRAPADAEALAAFGEEQEGWIRQRVSLDQDLTTLSREVSTDRARLLELQGALDAARGPDPTIAARAARLDALADDLDAFASQVENVARLDGQVAAAVFRADRLARERGVGSVQVALDAARDDDVVRRLDGARQRHLVEVATVRGQLAEVGRGRPQADQGASAVPPADDLPASRARAECAAGTVSAAEAARDTTAGELTRATARADACLRLGAVLREVCAEREPLAAAHRSIDGLSRLAEGKHADNQLRMSLSGYVLAARLEQVAASASERWSRMSSGRYQLSHTPTGAGGRARGGLHLRVLDAWTGVERDPATLSGGESFAASLALALGLADVVTREAGGALLETLFVDEGFGSLDDETLEDVMGVLDGLREGGRTVGIVSHVADLRQRVPVQLQIVTGRAGSHVRQCAPNRAPSASEQLATDWGTTPTR